MKSRLSWRTVLMGRAAREIPANVRQLVSPLGHYGVQFHALGLAYRVSGGADLLAQSPALAFCLAWPHAFSPLASARRRRWVLARRLIRLPQREIAAHLGFPPRGANILRKIVRPALQSVAPLLDLRRWIQDPRSMTTKYLAHLPRLNAGALALADPILLPHVDFHLLTEVARAREEDRFPRTSRLLGDTRGPASPARGLPLLRALEDLIFDQEVPF